MPAGSVSFYSPTHKSNLPQSDALCAKKTTNEPDADGEEKDAGMMGIFKKSPGAIVVAPFLLLFGLDLIANIAVITKRSLEVFFTGEYTVWTPWQ